MDLIKSDKLFQLNSVSYHLLSIYATLCNRISANTIKGVMNQSCHLVDTNIIRLEFTQKSLHYEKQHLFSLTSTDSLTRNVCSNKAYLQITQRLCTSF